MARNRVTVILEDSTIATVAERATEHHSGDFNAALEEMIEIARLYLEEPAKPKPAAKKTATKSRK